MGEKGHGSKYDKCCEGDAIHVIGPLIGECNSGKPKPVQNMHKPSSGGRNSEGAR
jgi:hypothetical protein